MSHLASAVSYHIEVARAVLPAAIAAVRVWRNGNLHIATNLMLTEPERIGAASLIIKLGRMPGLNGDDVLIIHRAELVTMEPLAVPVTV